MKFIFSLICFCGITNLAISQTSVSGIVVDSNKNPIPFADVTFVGSTKGTITNELGAFELASNQNYNLLDISFIGYKSKKIVLKNKITLKLIVTLKEESTSLNEIDIVTKPKKRLPKKENPAYKILTKIWQHRHSNGLKMLDHYQFQKFTTIELGLNNIDSSFLKKALKNDYNSIKLKIKQNQENKSFYIPVELLEKNETFYGDKSINKEKTQIEAEREIGVKQTGKILDRVATTFQDIDIYQNNIQILNKNFVSPLSAEGFGTYEYVLNDSTLINNKKYYTIYFFPREKGDVAFQGNFTVADKSFAIIQIDMKTLKSMNFNFVKNFEFKKTFTLMNDSLYIPDSNTYKGTFSLLTKSDNEKGIYVIKTEKFSNYNFSIKKSLSFFNKKQIQITSDQFNKNDTYWNEKQNEHTANTYDVVNKVKNNNSITNITTAIYILSDGYVNIFKGLQIGSLWSTTASNDIEGTRIQLGFRTYISDDDRFQLGGFGAYAFKDKKYKFGLEARYLLTRNHRSIISAAYLDDTDQMGLIHFNGNHLIAKTENGTKALFNRGSNYFLSKVKKAMVRYDWEPTKNLHIGLIASKNVIKSADSTKFSINYLDINSGKVKSTTTDVATDLYMSYTPGKETLGYGVDQKTGTKLHQTILFNYRKGYKNILGGNFNYNRIQVLYNYPISLGKYGIFDATVDAGKTFEATPLSILTAVSANQTYFLVPNTFALLDYYDFVADSYIEGHFEHHFNGLILNRIPLINKLKLRSVVTFRGVYGTISAQSKSINKSSIIYVAPSSKPYYEYGFGFENIGFGNIRPFRVDFIWRNNFVNYNGPVNPKFGIRVGIKTTF